jgi:hypothetical protein
MSTLLATMFGMLSVFGGVPEDVRKDVVIFNDTKAPVEVAIDGVGRVSIAPGASAEQTLAAYGPYVFSTETSGRSLAARYTLGKVEGQFQPPDRMRWCVSVQRMSIVLMARPDCYNRLRKR